MLATALAPEVLLAKYLGDLSDAKANLRELQRLADQDGVPWAITHSLFANMGGFVIRSHVPERVKGQKDTQTGPDISNLDPQPGGTSDVEELERQGQSQPKPSASNPQSVRVSDAMKSEGQGQSEPKSSDPDQLPPNEVHSSTELGIAVSKSRYRNPFFLAASDVLALRKSELLPRLPYITKEELNDKNKSDSLVRLFAVVQIIWIVVQIIVRASRHLAISQLEIAVIAFATCAIMMYGLNWEKPKGAQVPYTLLQYHGEVPYPVLKLVAEGPDHEGAIICSVLELAKFIGTFTLLDCNDCRRRGAPIPNHFTRDTSRGLAEFLGVTLGGVVFGAVHITAWNFVFPTLVERTLWRSSSIICTAVMVLIFPLFIIIDLTNEDWVIFSMLACLFIVFTLYIAARLFLIVEIFRTLCFLPPSAYIATWASNIPHIG
jgi:hypothetical protein